MVPGLDRDLLQGVTSPAHPFDRPGVPAQGEGHLQRRCGRGTLCYMHRVVC